MYEFGGLNMFKVDRSASDVTIVNSIDCVSDSAKLVMTNVKFQFFGMQMNSIIQISNGIVELNNVDFDHIIPRAHVEIPNDNLS